jgi:hypothetical protein
LHIIGGASRGSADRERRNPADANELVVRFPAGTNGDVEAAIEAASHAAKGWAATPAPERGGVLTHAAAILESRVAEVARDLTREEGKTLAESTGEVRRAVDVLRYYGAEGWRLSGETVPSATRGQMLYTKREPLGVVGVITPWNFPIAIPAWKIAPALVAGNAVVFKPASVTPLTASHPVRSGQPPWPAWHLQRQRTGSFHPSPTESWQAGATRARGRLARCDRARDWPVARRRTLPRRARERLIAHTVATVSGSRMVFLGFGKYVRAPLLDGNPSPQVG